jgi:hypothetical protein
LKSVKMKFSILPGQHSHQIWILLNDCDQFWRYS